MLVKFRLAALIAFLGAILFFLLNKHSAVIQTDTASKPLPPSQSLNFLSPDRYAQISQALFKTEDNQSPREALAQLRVIVATDSGALRSCHAIAHELGREAYRKYKDFGVAMEYQEEVCNSGYMHGVIEGYFAGSKEGVESKLRTVCRDYPEGKFLSWECYHGIGHGAMYYTQNDLPKSLKMCSSFSNAFDREACINGVFMENFNTDQKIHPSNYLNKQDPFYPCQTQSSSNKGDCYLYAPTYFLSLHPGEYKGALNFCQQAEGLYQQSCAQGVGAQVIKENLSNPKFAEEICQSNPKFESACIYGMTSLYINNFGELKGAEAMCETLDSQDQGACNGAIKTSQGLF